jgi:putative ABC transport system permease protein
VSHLAQWLRDARRKPGQLGFLVLSLSVALASALAAIALNAAVSWRDLPFAQADALVKVEVRSTDAQPRWLTWPELRALAADPRSSFSAMAAYTVADVGLTADGDRPPEALLATMVSPEFFGVLGVGLSAGRSFSDAEHQPGGPRAVLLSHELWQRRYGGDPAVIGRTVDVSLPDYLDEPGGRHLVVGVLAPQTWLFWRRFDMVTPFRADPKLLGDPRAQLIEHVVARLRPGATVVSAQASAPLLTAAMRQAGGGEATDTIQIAALRSALFRDLQPKLHLVLAIALVVFLLAGVNVVVAASTAALERQSETAVRLALGASPARLVRDTGAQLLVTVVVSSLLALLLSGSFIAAILGIVPDAWLARVPGGAAAVRVDTLGVAIAVVLLAALGAASALWAWRHMARLSVTALLAAIRHDDAPTRHRWRAMIVAGEVALCTTVVLVASTLAFQLWELRRVDLGVRADRTSAVWINANPEKYADPGRRATYFERLLGELGRVPGVEAVAGIDLTFQMDWQTVKVSVGDRLETPPLTALDRAATASYRALGGLTLIDGRWLDPRDRAGAPDVAVVSRSLAEALWPRQRAVGQTLLLDATKERRPITVVGVVSDVRHAPQAQPARVVYRSMPQAVPQWLYVLIRTDLTPHRTAAIASAVWRVDPDQTIDGPWTVQKWIDDRTAYVRFLANLTAMLAVVAMVLAAAGLHALMRYWVQAARRELGIRRAVGASHRDVLAWFGRRWASVVLPASALGVLLQFALMRATASRIESVQSASLVHLLVGTLVVVAYASGAAGTALVQALRVDEKVLFQESGRR